MICNLPKASSNTAGASALPDSFCSCAFNIGPEYLTVVIRAHGNQVWSSADCATGRRSVTTELVRGVPAILPVSWNLKKSGPGCAKTSRKKLAGRFVAAASDGSIASNAVRFTAG